MTITLRPGQERLIEEVLGSESYHRVQEVIDRWLELLQDRDAWLA